MKAIHVALCAFVSLASAAIAVTEPCSNNELRPASPEWYAHTEFHLGLSCVRDMTGNSWQDDLYLGIDPAWGGTLDLKYFFHRFSGFRVQGKLLAASRTDINFAV